MKLLTYVSCFFLAIFIFSCSGNLEPQNYNDNDLVNYTGTITDGYYIRSDAAYQGKINLFYPDNLPESYKKSGLRVEFSGDLIDCPVNVSCFAQEIKLSEIKVINDN